ncbi:MAG: hypothetical protein OXL37_11840 [Chloroflexota bacterium]|nr:hypothetical protein [Chloroflexota bacterium]MDE2962132.1 hypothetical protein [Chloroflexota bacterium]
MSNNNLSLETAGNTSGTRAVFRAENVGTTTITFTASASGDWANTTLKFDVQVYEPTVKTTDLNMPASVSMQEGETRYVAVDWIGAADNTAPLQNNNGVVVLPAAVGVVSANDSIRVTLQGTPGNRLLKIDALEDSDYDAETGEYQMYFGGVRARWNGKYLQTLTVNVTDNDDEPPTPTPTDTPTPSTNNPATGSPTISGTAHVGQTLTADTTGIADEDGIENVSYAYQWAANGVEIAGATSSTYILTESEAGKIISVTVAFSDDASNSESLTSAFTAAVTTDTMCFGLSGTAETNCLLREVLNELQIANAAPPLNQN